MKTRFLTVLAILPLLLAGPIKAAPPTVLTFPVDDVIVADCNGENVHVTGELIESFSVTTKNGLTHVSMHFRQHLDGVGLSSGETYTMNALFNEEENFKGSVFTFNITEHIGLISHGGSLNRNITFTTHITVNANGDVVVDRFDFSDDCVG